MSKPIFSDVPNVTYRDVPGFVLDYCSDSDGAVYSIDPIAESRKWDLYRIRKVKGDDSFTVEIDSV